MNLDIFQLVNLAVSGGVLVYVVRIEHRITRLETLLAEHIKADATVYERIFQTIERRLQT